MQQPVQCSVETTKGRLILLATILASGISFLLSTSVSIALPTIQAEFNAGINDIQWIFNAFAIALASLLLLCGSLGDHFGRKKIFSLGIIVFALGTALAGFSETVNQLIIFQALTGLGAAMMIPGSLAIINYSFEESSRGKAIGLWAGLSGGLAALGPFIGGWIVETWGWPWIFFLNAPLGLIAFLVTYRVVPESKNPDARKLDWWGTVFMVLGLFGLSFGLIQGPINGWADHLVLASLIGGAVALLIFLNIEGKIDEPMVPFKIFKNPLVAGANIVTLLLYFALNGVIFFLVLNFQQVQGYSPIYAGLGMLPPILLITFLSGPAGALADKIGPRKQMILGPLIVAIGMSLLIFAGANANYFTHFMPGLILFGLGMAAVIAPLTKSALAVEEKYSGLASGVNNAVSRIAALLAVAILGAMVVSIFTSSLNSSMVTVSLTQQEKILILEQSGRLAGIEIPENFDANSYKTAEKTVKESFVVAFRWAMGVAAGMALLSTVISYILIREKFKE